MLDTAVKKMKKEYPFMWSPLLAALPDWYEPHIRQLFDGIKALGDENGPIIGAASLNFQKHLSGDVTVSVAPVKDIGLWTTDQAMMLLIHVDAFNRLASTFCRECGAPSVGLFKTQMGREVDRFLCREHGQKFLGRPLDEFFGDALPVSN